MSEENTPQSVPPVYLSEALNLGSRPRRFRLPLLPRIAYRLTCFSLLAMVVQLWGHSAARGHPFVSTSWTVAWRLTILMGPMGAFLGVVWVWHCRHRTFALGHNYAWSAILVGVSSTAIGLGLAPGFEESAETLHYGRGYQQVCLSHVRQIDIGLTMYTQDYDDHLPLPDTWCDAAMTYIKNEYVYVCPQPYDNDRSKTPSYGFLHKLEGAEIGRIVSPAETVMVFDSVRGRNLSGGLALLPNPTRHQNGHNVGLIDGHAKFVSKSGIANLIWSPTVNPTSGNVPKKALNP